MDDLKPSVSALIQAKIRSQHLGFSNVLL